MKSSLTGKRLELTKPNAIEDGIATFFSRQSIVPASVLITVAFRFVLIVLAGGRKRFSDEDDYWNIATSIIHGGGFSLFGHLSAYRPPAMPYFLAMGMLLVGERYWVFALLQASLLCILPFLVLWTAESLKLPKAYAALAAVLVAFHPGLNYAATTIYPTTITAIALTLSTLLTLEAIERNSLAYGAFAGISAGIASFATTVFVPFGGILAIVAVFRRRTAIGICIVAVSLLPTAAWVARNYMELHTYSVATNGGFNMELGANDQAEPRSGNLISPEITPQERQGTEVDWDKAHHDRAKAWIQAHHSQFAKLFVLRSLAVLDSVGKPATQGLHNSPFAQFLGWIMLPLILLGFVGLLLSWRDSLAWMTAGALLLVIISSGLTIVKPRFRFPCDPLLIIFSVVAFRAIVSSSSTSQLTASSNVRELNKRVIPPNGAAEDVQY